jgi:arylsulfatase
LAAPATDIARFKGKYTESWSTYAAARVQRQRASGLINPLWTPATEPYDYFGEPQAATGEYAEQAEIYAAMVHRVDVSVGTMVDTLTATESLANTLILFLSDNGGTEEGQMSGNNFGDPTSHTSEYRRARGWGYLSNTPFRSYKAHQHEGGIASPLIAHWPAMIVARPAPTAWEKTPCHVIDLMPTILEAAGASPIKTTLVGATTNPLPIEGQSLMPLLLQPISSSSETQFASRPIFWEHTGRKAVRVGQYKLVAKRDKVWQLHDMLLDRTEQTDIRTLHPNVATTLETLWNSWGICADAIPNNPWLQTRVVMRAGSSCTDYAVETLPTTNWCNLLSDELTCIAYSTAYHTCTWDALDGSCNGG